MSGLQKLLELVVPAAEKGHYALTFHDANVSLIVVFGVASLCVALSLLLLIVPVRWIVFVGGMAVLLPMTFKGLLHSLLGEPVDVYELHLMEARNLAAFDVGGTSDPYLVGTGNLRTVSGSEVRTECIKKTLAPVWNESFRVPLPPGTDTEFTLDLYDRDIGKKDDLMGRVVVRVQDFLEARDKWLDVCNGEGEVHVSLRFVGSTWARFQTSKHAFWREWPTVRRLTSKLETVRSFFCLAWLHTSDRALDGPKCRGGRLLVAPLRRKLVSQNPHVQQGALAVHHQRHVPRERAHCASSETMNLTFLTYHTVAAKSPDAGRSCVKCDSAC